MATAWENAAANGFDDSNPSESVTINIPPSSGPHTGDSNFVEVILSESPQTFFIHVLLPGGGQVSARGVAGQMPFNNGGLSVIGGSAPDACRRREDEEPASGGGGTPTDSAWSPNTASDSGDGVSNDGHTTSGASAEDDSGANATDSAWNGSGPIPTASDSGDGVSNDGHTTSGPSADDLSASADAYECVVLVE